MLQYNVSRMFKFLEKTIKQEAEMFHEMLDLKGLEKEVQKYRYKIEDAELFILKIIGYWKILHQKI